MKKPSYGVRRMRQGGYEIDGYAVDEQYEGDPAQTVTAGHATRTQAEASAAALQGAIERFAARTAPAPDHCQSCGGSVQGEPYIVDGQGGYLHLRCYTPNR